MFTVCVLVKNVRCVAGVVPGGPARRARGAGAPLAGPGARAARAARLRRVAGRAGPSRVSAALMISIN